MKPVGLRELKARLSHYIRQVRSGRRILVSDRGEVVAELAPPGHAIADVTRLPAALAALARKGHLTLAPNPGATGYPELGPALRRRRAQELLDAERGGS